MGDPSDDPLNQLPHFHDPLPTPNFAWQELPTRALPGVIVNGSGRFKGSWPHSWLHSWQLVTYGWLLKLGKNGSTNDQSSIMAGE